MEVLIEKLDHQGRGLAKKDGKIIFVKNALPGEEVEIKIIKSSKKFDEAEIVKINKKSSKRIESKCPYYELCGGCDLLHLSYEEQLIYKEQKVKEIIERYADLRNIMKPIIKSDEEFNYRNKVTLKSNGKLGYYKKRSNEIVNIDYCYLVNKKLNDIIQQLNEIGIENNVDEIIIRSINETETALTFNLQNEEKSIEKYKKYENICDSLFLNINGNIKEITSKGNIIGRLKEKKYEISPTAFFQVNTNQTIKLYDKILEYVMEFDNPKVLDLYCGTGTIGIYVSKYAKEVLGVEINSKAIVDANKNKRLNDANNITFISGDTKDILNKNNFSADIVIVDPPRAGLDKEVIKDLFKINSKRIIYVSCDPITLARDLNLLKEKYNVIEITPVDMFPNTYHIETVVLLSREKANDYIRISVHTEDLKAKAN